MIVSLFACTEVMGSGITAGNISAANTLAIVVGVLFLLSFALFACCTRRLLAPTLILGLLILHPAWTISAALGDCGEFKHFSAWVTTVLSVGILIFQLMGIAWRSTYSPKVAQP